ncbi:MAG TPA: hypothetical protein VJM33_02785 [Microthrixaceae bacterium]|nr:hypothetical protein [Microthrixaceae bacterium]
MPWCDDCARFYNPNTLDTEGDCPEGHHVADPESDADEEKVRVPWHFWVLVTGVVLYLGWRLVQGIIWVLHQL